MRLNCVGLLLILLASGIVFSQNNVRQENENLDVVLLKRNLADVIKEAENSPANDVNALLRKLDLYNRAANNQKIAATVKQIAATDLKNTVSKPLIQFRQLSRMRILRTLKRSNCFCGR